MHLTGPGHNPAEAPAFTLSTAGNTPSDDLQGLQSSPGCQKRHRCPPQPSSLHVQSLDHHHFFMEEPVAKGVGNLHPV